MWATLRIYTAFILAVKNVKYIVSVAEAKSITSVMQSAACGYLESLQISGHEEAHL